jgi:AraC-like DNA-binding protein
MDPLRVLLDRTSVQGSIFCRAQLGAPWALHTSGMADGAAVFHAVVRGAGWVHVHAKHEARAVAGPIAWRAGDIVVMPHGDPHVMSDSPTTTPVAISSLANPRGPDGLPCVTHGGAGPQTTILCGTFHFGPTARDVLLPHLPALLHSRAGEGPTAAWLDATLRMIGAELNGAQPGSEAIVTRLADVLFIQAVRDWISRSSTAGWLSALRDPQLSRALAAIHADPGGDWSAATLAREAGMSRSSLYTRFTDAVGESPAAYVLRWRMQRAREALGRGNTGIAAVAEEVGYASEAAFSRAFKRHVGSSPSVWRAARRVHQPA